MRHRMRFTGAVLSLALLAFLSSATPPAGGSQKHDKNKGKVVYVCACLGTQSCSCMTEAKTEGPCACGTQGGPTMQAVAPDSNWAKGNRDALAK